MDKTTSGIREETKHAEDVAERPDLLHVVCIAILILVMVLELIIGLQ